MSAPRFGEMQRRGSKRPGSPPDRNASSPYEPIAAMDTAAAANNVDREPMP
jgi:hypothetical protein